MGKKAQVWGFDLIIASLIFTFGIITFFLFTLNSSDIERAKIQDITYEGNIIADSLMTSGFPEDWNETNIVRIGIVNKGKINQTKLERFYNLSSSNYQGTRELFNVKYQYYINISEKIEINNIEIPSIGAYTENPNNLIKITRVTIYKDKPVTLNIIVWE
jgi:hypothetical protein